MRNLILSLLVLFTIANVTYAQTVSPDSLLDGSPPDMSNSTPKQEKKQETRWQEKNLSAQNHM